MEKQHHHYSRKMERVAQLDKKAKVAAALHNSRKSLKRKFQLLEKSKRDMSSANNQFFSPVTTSIQRLIDAKNEREDAKFQDTLPAIKPEPHLSTQYGYDDDDNFTIYDGNQQEEEEQSHVEEEERKKQRDPLSITPQPETIYEFDGNQGEAKYSFRSPLKASSPIHTAGSSSSLFANATTLPPTSLRQSMLDHKSMLTKQIRSSLSDPGEKNISKMEKSQMEAETSTSEGQRHLEWFLRNAPPYARHYYNFLATGKWDNPSEEIDRDYGPIVQGSQGVTLGNTNMTFDRNNLYFNGIPYKSTPGLYRLLFLKNPRDYTHTDLQMYSDIMKQTSAAHYAYNPHLRVRRIGLKHANIIKHIYPIKRGMGKKKEGSGLSQFLDQYRSSDNDDQSMNYSKMHPDDIVKRLELILAGISAGNHRLQRTANSLINELISRGYIASV